MRSNVAYQSQAIASTTFQTVAKPAQRVLRFVSSSLTCTFVDQGIAAALFAILRTPMGADSFARILIACVVARLVSLFLNFTINNKLVFDGDDAYKRRAFMRFLALAGVCLTVSSVCVWWVHTTFGAPETAVKIVVDGTLFVVNYNVQRLWVFKSDEDEELLPEVAELA